jgi:hypothetical protein
MTAIINQSERAVVKEHLRRVSSMLQYLSFEFLENLLLKTKTLNLKAIQQEFLLLA